MNRNYIFFLYKYIFFNICNIFKLLFFIIVFILQVSAISWSKAPYRKFTMDYKDTETWDTSWTEFYATYRNQHIRGSFLVLCHYCCYFIFLVGGGGCNIFPSVFGFSSVIKAEHILVHFIFPLPKECGAIFVLYHHWTKFTQAKQVAFEPTIHNLLLGLQLIPSCFSELFRFGRVNCTGVVIFAIIEPDDNKHKWTTSQCWSSLSDEMNTYISSKLRGTASLSWLLQSIQLMLTHSLTNSKSGWNLLVLCQIGRYLPDKIGISLYLVVIMSRSKQR